MKQRLFQNMLKAAGAFLFAVTMSAGFTACTDTIDNPATPVDPDPENERELVDPTPEPTEDAVAYTIDCSYAVFGNIDDEIGKAISRRLKGTPDVPSMAQLYFLDPQRGKDLGMGEAYWQELVRRTRNGEASLVLSQCTFSDFHTFTKYYIQGMMELAAMQYVGDDPDAKPDTEAMQAEAEKRMADALREGWQFWRDRQANPEAFDEPDWQNIDSWPAEMQDAVMFDAWGFHGANHMLYVVHSAMQDEGNEANYDISNPVFEGVTISSTAAQAVESTTAGLETVQMVGTYSPVGVTADDKSILFLGDANTLYYSTVDRRIRSCRAYFSVPYINGHAGAKARAFALSFDGEETTDIPEVSANSNEVKDDVWYSLDGVRLSGKPTQRGMYINKGKKILVK